MSTLQSVIPKSDVLLLGPGPSPVSDSVRAALGAPSRSHLDPEFMAVLDDVRVKLAKVFGAPAGSIVGPISGTGTSGMETVVANLCEPGTRALVIVTGYFGDRLAQMFERYGAHVERLNFAWGTTAEPQTVVAELKRQRYDFVAAVHVETSTGVVNPIREIGAAAREHDALFVVDAVTSIGAMPFDASADFVDACYTCSQKGLGAPSGLAPVLFTPRALARKVKCRSFYFDLDLLEAYWTARKYHHTMSAPLLWALFAALSEVDHETLAARWDRHSENHRRFASGLDAMGWSLLPSPNDRSWSLNAVNVPAGVDDGAVRKHLLADKKIEIGAGLGPLSGNVFRVGLMGAGSTAANVDLLLSAFREVSR
jgi:alanine-glyoxylate transaminase/serine-glyoxylate transaminase/serine-pyruvate transaminase